MYVMCKYESDGAAACALFWMQIDPVYVFFRTRWLRLFYGFYRQSPGTVNLFDFNFFVDFFLYFKKNALVPTRRDVKGGQNLFIAYGSRIAYYAFQGASN